MREAGFHVRERIAIPMFHAEFEDNTCGKKMLEMRGITASLRVRPMFFSLNRYMFVADKPAEGIRLTVAS